MADGVEVTRIADLEERWEDAVADTNDRSALYAETEVATVRSLGIMSELAQTPAANMTDLAIKISIVARDLRLHAGERLLALLLESAEQDCLRIAADGRPANA
jgi:hypothetical protein